MKYSKYLCYFIFNSEISGFPDRSVSKESACNAGDPSLIPGLERREGIGYLPQYS